MVMCIMKWYSLLITYHRKASLKRKLLSLVLSPRYTLVSGQRFYEPAVCGLVAWSLDPS